MVETLFDTRKDLVQWKLHGCVTDIAFLLRRAVSNCSSHKRTSLFNQFILGDKLWLNFSTYWSGENNPFSILSFSVRSYFAANFTLANYPHDKWWCARKQGVKVPYNSNWIVYVEVLRGYLSMWSLAIFFSGYKNNALKNVCDRRVF